MAVAKCEHTRSEYGKPAHPLRAGYFAICGVTAEGRVYPAIAPTQAGQGCCSGPLGDCSRFIEDVSQSGLFSACFPAGKGAGCRARAGTLGQLRRDRPGFLRTDGCTDIYAA